MSVQHYTWVWKVRGLTPAERLVLLALADSANRETHTCWRSNASLQEQCELTRRGIQKAVRGLTGKGAILCRFNAGRGGSNLYTMLVEGANTVRPFPSEKANTVRGGEQSARGEHSSPPRTQCAGGGELSSQRGEHSSHEPLRTVVGGGGARARVPASPFEASPDETQPPDLFTRVFETVGLAKLSTVPSRWMPPAAAVHVSRWRDDLGLTPEQILDVIQGEQRRKQGAVPDGPKAFDRAMQNFAATLATPALRKETSHAPATGDRRQDRAEADLDSDLEWARRMDAASGRG